MKLLALAWFIAILSPFTALASDHDFNRLAATMQQTCGTSRQHIPLLGLASFSAHLFTRGDVRGIKIAAFDQCHISPEVSASHGLLEHVLGPAWLSVVESRSGHGSDSERTAIFARLHGPRIILMIATLEADEYSLVRVELDGREFQRWMRKYTD